MQHQRTFRHRVAVTRLTGQCAPTSSREVPLESAFVEAIDAVKRGGRHAKCAVDHKKTFAKLIWCVREGKRRLDRRFMSTASSIALHQDAAGKRLLMNFRAANLETQWGLLGH